MAQLREDRWAWVDIGNPFPDNPFRAKGQTNMYVALWYKFGMPVCGRAWNNGGVVEASFPYKDKELTGARDLQGKIQVLQFDPDLELGYKKNGYWYDWAKWKDSRQDHFQLVRCGNAVPCLIPHSSGLPLIGNIDIKNEVAACSLGGKAENLTGGKVQELLVLVRDKRPPPPPDAPKPRNPDAPNEWVDVNVRSQFRTFPVPALGRPLKMEDGSTQEQHVALWYKHGEPVMGRCWNNGGVYEAAFGWDGKEFAGNVGSFQVLRFTTADAMGFEYSWRTFREAYAKTEGWRPVHVADVAPCVIKTKAGFERLGKVFMKQEKAGVAYGGKEEVYQGPQVQDFMVLCRKP